jgi:DNA-binding IclR family transcriptional regulator
MQETNSSVEEAAAPAERSARGIQTSRCRATETAAGIVGAVLDQVALEAQLVEMRCQSMVRVVDQAIHGVSALAAPVFDGQGRLPLSITGIGPSATVDTAGGGVMVGAIRHCAASLSRRLGAAA